MKISEQAIPEFSIVSRSNPKFGINYTGAGGSMPRCRTMNGSARAAAVSHTKYWLHSMRSGLQRRESIYAELRIRSTHNADCGNRLFRNFYVGRAVYKYFTQIFLIFVKYVILHIVHDSIAAGRKYNFKISFPKSYLHIMNLRSSCSIDAI